MDGEQLHCWQSTGLGAGEVFTVEDWVYSANRGAGSHHFALSVDPMNSVAESDEGNNTAERDFTWLPSEMDAQSIGSPLINDALQTPDLPDIWIYKAQRDQADRDTRYQCIYDRQCGRGRDHARKRGFHGELDAQRNKTR